MHPLGEGGAVSQVTNSGTKWQRKVKEEGEREEEEEWESGRGQDKNLFLLFLISPKKINATCSKSKGREGVGAYRLMLLSKGLGWATNKTSLGGHAELLCTSLRRSRNRQSHEEIAHPSWTFF